MDNLQTQQNSAKIVATKTRVLDPYNTKNPELIKVSISFSAGLLWSIIWDNCPHTDNVIESWIQKKETAVARVKKLGWTLVEYSKDGLSQKVNGKLRVQSKKAQYQPKEIQKPTQIGQNQITCDFCNKPVFPSEKNPTLFEGFRDLDTKMFIGRNCYNEYYKAKHTGKFGKEHAGKYSEYPEDVPFEPNKIEYHFDYLSSRFTHSEPVEVKVDFKWKEIIINWKQPTKRNNMIIPIGSSNFDYIKMQLNDLGFSRTDNPVNKNVSTKTDCRFLPEKDTTHNIFEVGDFVIAITNGKDPKDGKFGWENTPKFDKVIGFEKSGNTFHYLTEESPKGMIHPSRLFPCDKANRIELFGIDFIHHEPCELMTPGGTFYIQFSKNSTKVIGDTFKSFRLPVMVNNNQQINDLENINNPEIEKAIWMMLKNGFTILHWKNNPPVHKNILKRKNMQNVATKEIETEATKIDSSEIPVKFIGQFGYNEKGVLVEGAIVTIEIKTSKIYAKAEIGQTSHGWAIATKNESKFYHDGSGGSSYLVSLNSRYQFISQEEAKIASIYHLKRALEYEFKNAPENAAKAFKKEIDLLASLIRDTPEPTGFDILAKPKKEDVATKEKPLIKGLYGCSCHSYSSWEECNKYHKQSFNIGDIVQNRCNGKIGVVEEYSKVNGGHLSVKYGDKPSDIEAQHVAMLNLVKSRPAIIETREPKKPARIKKVDPFAPKGGPRTEMTKFRCSKDFKEILSDMAKIKNCSVADLIHYAIKALPRLDSKLVVIEQERLNEII